MAITQKNNKFYCRFQLNGERHHYLCRGASNKKEAERMENAFIYKLQQIKNGVISKDPKQEVKLKTLYDLFEQYSKTNKKSYCVDVYILRVLKSYFPETMSVDDVRYSRAEAFKQFLLNDRGCKNATVNKYLNVLRKMFNIGIAEGLITDNPLKTLKQLKEPNYKVRFLTPEEENRMFKVIDREYSYIKPIVICALHTGMRKSEILTLKWSNIDMDYRFIELLETKSGKARRIPISDTLYDVLEHTPHRSDYVFINPETKERYKDIHKAFYAVLNKAGISNFRFHDLRHTAATRLAECNIDLVVIKELLGHSKIETTMRYAHAVPKRKIDAISVLNSYNKKMKNGHRTDTVKMTVINGHKVRLPQTMTGPCF